MKHITEEQLVWFYYGEAAHPEKIREHLLACDICQKELEQIRATLSQVLAIEAPEPALDYEAGVWRALEARIENPGRRSHWPQMWFPKAAWAGAFAFLLLGAFLAGRYLPHSPTAPPSNQAKANPERIVLVTVGEHLERSQMLLVEIMSTDGTGNQELTAERQRARDLLDANRLYRESAARTGDPTIGRVLDELERVLVEIANSPSGGAGQELKAIRKQIESEGLLFQIRVIDSRVQQRPGAADVATPKLQGKI